MSDPCCAVVLRAGGNAVQLGPKANQVALQAGSHRITMGPCRAEVSLPAARAQVSLSPAEAPSLQLRRAQANVTLKPAPVALQTVLVPSTLGVSVQTLPCVPALAVGQLASVGADGVALPADCTQLQAVLGMTVQVHGGLAQIQTAGPAPCVGPLVPGQSYFLGLGGLPAPHIDPTVLYVQRLGVALSAGSLLLNLAGPSVRRLAGP